MPEPAARAAGRRGLEPEPHRKRKRPALSSRPLPSGSNRYLLQRGSPSPAPALIGFAVATAMPQLMPGICGCVTVASQYDVLGVRLGEPTADVCEYEVSSVIAP